MSMSALNLRVNKQTAEKAKKMVQNYGTSLSTMVEHFFLRLIEANKPPPLEALHPLIRNLAGSISSEQDFRDAVHEEIEKKYGQSWKLQKNLH